MDALVVNRADDRSLFRPTHVAIDRSHTPRAIYVADSDNSRVLAWRDLTRLRAGQSPDLVIGQPDAGTVRFFRRDAQALTGVRGLVVGPDGTLWVTDQSNGRVLGFRWPFDPTKSDQDNRTADVLIGQPDFGVGYVEQACNGGVLFGGPLSPSAVDRLCNPSGLALSPAGDLYVADTSNSRILRFPAPIPTRNARPDLLFGQTGHGVPTDQACNRGGIPGTNTLCRPSGLAFHVDGTTERLYVADTQNNRVLVFDDPARNQTASRVFGQADFMSAAQSQALGRFYAPAHVAVAPSGVVWVSDSTNSRVLGFAPPFTGTAGFTPKYIVGHTALDATGANRGTGSTPTPAPTDSTIYASGTPDFTETGTMFLPDTNNNRLLIIDRPEAIGPSAQAVVGQVDFTHGVPNRGRADSLAGPAAVALDRRPGGPIHVYVADFANNRVLGWYDLSALKSGQAADLALGQPDLNAGHCNAGKPLPTAQTLCWPRSLAVDDNGDLWVADAWNNRVLRFRSPFLRGPGSQSGQAADLVLGQQDFSSRRPNRAAATPSANTFFGPFGLAFDDEGVLWVADFNNHRVLGFTPPFTSGTAATRVLIGGSATGDLFAQAGCPTATRAAALCGPSGVATDAQGGLWVADSQNHRVLRFRRARPRPGDAVVDPVPLVVLGQRSATEIAANQGATNPSATSLRQPTAVSIETSADRRTVAIAVADAGNSRILLYPPTERGEGVAATQVVGQDGRFDQRLTNLGSLRLGETQGITRGLFYPGGVTATPEGIFIAESNAAVFSGVLNVENEPSNLFRFDGNNRVLIIKGPSFPAPTPMNPPDMNTPAPDLGQSPDAGTPPMQNDGCHCDTGRRGAPGSTAPAAALLLLFLIRLARRRR
jgi:sugar lactone lactonase YvrE